VVGVCPSVPTLLQPLMGVHTLSLDSLVGSKGTDFAEL
jgi:hypothetical protein